MDKGCISDCGQEHFPVMLPEVIEALAPCDGEVYVDGTFGAGGYSRAILDAADCRVYAIDRDVNARKIADDMKSVYGDRFEFLRGCFGDVTGLLEKVGQGKVNGFVLDVGVSSMQIDEAERGFSFRFDGPLDMRMDAESGVSAADIVNFYEEEDLANIIYEYGQERYSRRIARAIFKRRKEVPFERTQDLADIVRSVVPKSKGDKIDPATRTFQALRIVVNDELGELSRALDASGHILDEGGRLVVVSFHSLEDGAVKQFLKQKSGSAGNSSRYLPETGDMDEPVMFDCPLRNKTVKPSQEETQVNSRSRSARMRYGIRTSGAVGKGGAI